MPDSLTLTTWDIRWPSGAESRYATEAGVRKAIAWWLEEDDRAVEAVRHDYVYRVGDACLVQAFGRVRLGIVVSLAKSRVTVRFHRNKVGDLDQRAFGAVSIWPAPGSQPQRDEREGEHASVEAIEAAIVAGERAAAAERDASWHDMRTPAERAATEPKLTGVTGPRSEVRIEVEPADVRHPSGPVAVRSWTRVIGGIPHSFRAIAMPNGERRYVATRYNGYGDDGTEAGRRSGMRFGCAWSPAAFWKVPPPAPTAHLECDDLDPDTDERGAELAELASERASHDAEQAAETSAWSALSAPDDCPSCSEGGEPDQCDQDCPTRTRAAATEPAATEPTAEVLALLAEIGYPDPTPEKLAELADSDPWGEGDVLRGATWGPAERIEIPAEALAELAEVLDPAALACPECGEPVERAVIERAGWALSVPPERLQYAHRDDGTPLCPVMSADSGVVPALPVPRTSVTFSETDPATWSVPDPVRGTPYVIDNLPRGYEWREIDDSGELHLWSPDGRNVSAEYYAGGAVPPQGAAFLALALDRVAADLDHLSGEIEGRTTKLAEHMVSMFGRDSVEERAECQAFAYCTNEATVVLPHPIIGDFPACQSCADKLASLRTAR